MTAPDEDRADALFHALADRTRRDIVRRVLAGEHSVSTLAASYDMSFAAVQKHVAVLERAGLVTKRRIGREALASGDVKAVRSVASMLDEIEAVWRGRIGRMDELLATGDPPTPPPATQDDTTHTTHTTHTTTTKES
ncbi:ArsR/SmtB family transcription factor [Aeromicrobium sp. CF4.19]|uniref:ArsR/SmtB family transcription factor n=1 Tax=Aeromicrobium sp. CF4.19 TaxID=3373082 RepID=UPI003EE525F7